LQLYKIAVLYFIVVLSITGNAIVMGVDVSLTLSVLTLFLFLVLTGYRSKVKIKKVSLIFAFFIFFTAFVFLIKSIFINIEYFHSYWLWPIKAILLLIVLFLIDINNQKKTSIFSYSKIPFFILIFFSIILLLFATVSDGRLTFIFGPNMLYRWLDIFIIFSLLFSMLKDGRMLKIGLAVAIVTIGFLLLFKIGSKGGVLVLSAVSLSLLLPSLKKAKIFIVSVCILAVIFLYGEDYGEVNRAMNFVDIADSTRYNFYYNFYNDNLYLSGLLGEDYEIFKKYNSYSFMYPHNAFLELILFYGIFGYILVFVAIRTMYLANSKIIQFTHDRQLNLNILLSALYLIMLYSSMLSGDLSDNYSFISLGLYGLIRWK
jgi:hypothetical protein